MKIIMTFLPFAAMLGVMWFIMIRPQQKQARERKDMLDNMQAGQYVITIGGLHGIIDEINREKQTVVLDCEGVYLTFNLSAIAVVKQAESTKAIEMDVEVESKMDNLAPEA